MSEFGDRMQTAIDDAAGHVDRAQGALLGFLTRPTSITDAVAAIGTALQQLAQARAALTEAERIRFEASPRRQSALRREAERRDATEG